jgi:hypothetical protein
MTLVYVEVVARAAVMVGQLPIVMVAMKPPFSWSERA